MIFHVNKDLIEEIESELKYICVEGLNGFLKHEIHLKEEGITILHGPNGCGKTTLLDMVMHFYNSNYAKLSLVDFERFTLIHEINNEGKIEEKTIVFNKNIIEYSEDIKPNTLLSNFERNCFKNQIDFYRLTVSIDNKSPETLLSRPIDDYHDFSSETNFSRKVKFKYAFDDELRRVRIGEDLFGDEHNFYVEEMDDSGRRLLNSKKYMDIKQLSRSLKFFMVKTQRLIYMPSEINERDKKNYGNLMIERYAKDIAQKIATSLAESNEKTASHNKSFPERLIQNINIIENTHESENDIRLKYKETQDKITKILNAGLLFREKNIALPDESLNKDNVKTVLSLYLQDLNEKLSVYDDLLEKIETFQEIVGQKIRNKDMKIHYEKGFYFTSKHGDKRELKLSELSSGEQHQIVLFYELIFLADSGTYYLIDEPEISLHVDWQRSFLDDILRVENLRGHKFIIATHSPQIIGSRRSLCVSLDGGIL